MGLLSKRRSLRGKRVLITGGANGLGLELARLFARADSVLLLTDIDAAGLTRAAAELTKVTPAVHTYKVDISDQVQVDATVREVLAEVGGVDILINNAGISHVGELVETSISEWRKLVDVNLFGPLHLTAALVPSMARGSDAQIINVCSGQVFYRLPTWGPYTAVKSALAAYSDMLALEVRKLGIYVTTVHPFIMDTEGFYENIEGETWGSKLSLKLAPIAAMKPDAVARKIVRAVERRKPTEMVTPLNWVTYYARVVPGALQLANRVTFRLLGKPRDQLIEQLERARADHTASVTSINRARG